MRSLRAVFAFVVVSAASLGPALALDRPQWMDSPGIVMAGNWEEPTFRARRMGRLDYTLPPDKIEAYQREHSPEMIARLKDLGVNFVMIHCYKGAGMQTERQGMEDAKRFADLAHKAGLRVGTYVGGTMLYERLFKEEPNAPQWQAFGPDGGPIFYNKGQQFRYASVRNNPGFIEYLQKPVRYAIDEVHSDLIHFDNFGLGAASYDAFSKAQFRAFLKAHGKAEADPPVETKDLSNPLVRDWCDYKCQALADHYAAMSKFIHSLNPQCGVEANPHGVGGGGGATRGIDHARLLPLGNAFWDEAYGPDSPRAKGPGIRRTRIRTMKVARLYNNSAFLYTETPLDAAENMAFNLNCLGCVAWFEWGDIAPSHGGKLDLEALKPYIRFFTDHQDLYRNSKPVADVAVLRTFTDESFGPRRYYPIEQALIEGHTAWRIIYDEHLSALDDYRVVVAPDKEWLTPDQQQKLSAFEKKGAQVVPASKIEKPSEFPASLRQNLRLLVDAPPSVAIELCQQDNPQRVLVHLVNYDPSTPLKDIPVRLRLTPPVPPSARLLSPAAAPAGDRPLPVTTEAALSTFTVPDLQVYALIVLEGTSVR